MEETKNMKEIDPVTFLNNMGNHRQRRRNKKRLKKENKTLGTFNHDKWIQDVNQSVKFGKLIQQTRIVDAENQSMKMREEMWIRMRNSLVDKFGEEEGERIFQMNLEIENKKKK